MSLSKATFERSPVSTAVTIRCGDGTVSVYEEELRSFILQRDIEEANLRRVRDVVRACGFPDHLPVSVELVSRITALINTATTAQNSNGT